MSVGLATHGVWCGAKTYPTRCKFCHQNVFYFHCNCGSKVFFSELGGAWPEHRCVGYLVATYGKEFVQAGMAAQMMKHPASRMTSRIEKSYELLVKTQFKKRSAGERWIESVSPDGKKLIQTTGVVRDIICPVDVYKRFRISGGSIIGRAFLLHFGKEEYGQVTVHAGDLSNRAPKSYTGLVLRTLVEAMRLQLGDLVVFTARPVAAGGIRLWHFEDLFFFTK